MGMERRCCDVGVKKVGMNFERVRWFGFVWVGELCNLVMNFGFFDFLIFNL